MLKVKRALLSVSDKRGLVPFAQALSALGAEILSTGGTARALREAGVPVIDVSDKTGFPEIMDGRVKTLHPVIHGGLLGRRGIDDRVMAEHGIEPIDLLAVNLYPFEDTIARSDATLPEAIENIDIGGPAMIRAASKNHESLAVVVDPADYEAIVEALRRDALDLGERRRLAAKAYAHTASLRHGDRPLHGRYAGRRTVRRTHALFGQARPAPALRRKPASGGGVLRRPAGRRRLAGSGRAAAGQSPVLQQHRRQ